MSWDSQGGQSNKARKPAVYLAAVGVAVAVIGAITFIAYQGNKNDGEPTATGIGYIDGRPVPRSEIGTQGGPDDPLPTTPRPPYIPPPTIVAAPVIQRATPAPGAPSGPEGAVGSADQLALQYNVPNSGLSPQLYTELSNRSVDIVASMLRRDIGQRYPGFFIASPTMRNWDITFGTAMVPTLSSAQGKYYRGLVFWSGSPTMGPAIEQAQTAIYFKADNFEPINAVDLPKSVQGDDPAVRTTYFKG